MKRPVLRVRCFNPPLSTGTLVIGAGACGLSAALAARDAGREVVVLERDAAPGGSTALSSGFVPACATRWQRAAGVDDSVERMTEDILAKARGQTDADIVRAIASHSGATLEWLADRHGVTFELLGEFIYPGHSRHRMHAVPERTGAALCEALRRAAVEAGADVITEATVVQLVVDDASRVLGVTVERPDGGAEQIGCERLVLACNGFGGNAEQVARHIPEMRDALYFGHAGNQGDALAWGDALGAASADLGAYQGHGSVASPHGVLITWALMMRGAIQVNARGTRFSNEHAGYSEQSVEVLAQPGQIAWNVFDERLLGLARTFPDFETAEAAGAVCRADNAEALAAIIGCDTATLASCIDTAAACARGESGDAFGRDFSTEPPLAPPYYAVRVTGALFHTQGGLVVDAHGRVLRADGSALPNLYAGGGAARGVSGPAVWGYLSGNGLLSAVVLGARAGRHGSSR